MCVCVCVIFFLLSLFVILYIFLHLTAMYSSAFGKGWVGRTVCTFGMSVLLVVLACESLHVCTVCIWRCEHARFCVEVFYALYINCHSIIHSFFSLSLSYAYKQHIYDTERSCPDLSLSGLKSAQIHSCKQYVWSYNKSVFNTVHFNRNPVSCSCGGPGGSKAFGTFNWSFSFRVTARQA